MYTHTQLLASRSWKQPMVPKGMRSISSHRVQR
jgi:hypothetical protein